MALGDLEPLQNIGAWSEAAESALLEVAMAALGCDGTVLTRASEAPALVGGAYLQLIGDREIVHVGLCAEERGLAWLATSFVGDERLSTADIHDAVGELVNMVAGGVKRRMSAARPGLQLGLPLFIQGHLEPGDRQTLDAAFVQLAGCQVVLVVLHAPRG